MFGRRSVGERVAATCSVGVVRPAVRAILLVVLVLSPAAASAVTVSEIVTLSRAGVSESVILALIDRDQTVLSIEPEQLVSLKREGLSDTLLTAMLRSGREQGDEAARADASRNAADIMSSVAMSATPNPPVVIVGHGPDRPNTGYADGIDRSIRTGPIVVPYAPYGLPYAAPYKGGWRARAYDSRPGSWLNHDADRLEAGGYRGERLLCRAQINTPRGPGPSYITECPAVMQTPLRPR
jgi:hypothetical protein